MRSWLVTVVAIAIAGCSSTSEQQALLNTQLTPIENLQSGVLDNGLRYMVLPTEHDVISVHLYVDTGSIDETEDELGFAHLLEHAAFLGTENVDSQAIATLLDELGYSQDSHLNASTFHNYTEYYVSLDESAVYGNAYYLTMDWYADIAHGRFAIDEAQFNNERQVVNAERVYRQDSSFWNADYEMLLKGTPAEFRDPIGDKEIIAQANVQQLQDFGDKHYSPSNSTLVIVGKVNPRQIEYIETAFAGGEDAKPQPYRLMPEINPDTLYFEDRRTESLTSLQLYAPFPPTRTYGDALNLFLGFAFEEILQQRLFEATRLGDQHLSDIEVGNEYLNENFASYLFAYHGEDEHVHMITLFREQLALLLQYGLSEREIEGLEDFLERSRVESIEDWGAEDYVAEIYFNNIDGSVTYDPVVFDALIKTLLAKVDSNYINNQLKQWVARPVRWGFGGPRLDLDAIDQAVAADLATLEPPRYQFDELQPPQITAAAGSVVASSPLLSAEKLTLSNGMTVFLEPRRDSDTISVVAARKGGYATLNSDMDKATANFASIVWEQSGLTWASATELERYLEEHHVDAYPFFDANAYGVEFDAEPHQIDHTLQMLHHFLTTSTSNEAVFERVKQESIADLTYASPIDDFYDHLDEDRYHGKGYFNRFNANTLQQVTLDDVEQLRQALFADPNNFIVSIVGNFERDTIEPMLERYLASLPQGQSYPMAQPWQYQQPKSQRVTVTGGDEGQNVVLYGFVTPVYKPTSVVDRNSYFMVADIAQARLEKVMREELGYVYGVELYYNYHGGHQNFNTTEFEIYVDPQNTEAAISAMETVITQLRDEGVTEQEYQRFMTLTMDTIASDIEEDYVMAFLFAEFEMSGLDPLAFLNYPITLQQISIDSLNSHIEQLFDPQGLSVGVLLDE